MTIEKRKGIPKSDEVKILSELKKQRKVLNEIKDILDAQWRGRNPY